MKPSTVWRRRSSLVASAVLALAVLAPGTAALAKKKTLPPPPAPVMDPCADIDGGRVITAAANHGKEFVPGAYLAFEEDLKSEESGDFSDQPHPSCIGWDYTLTVYGNQADLDANRPVGTETIAGDGVTSVLQFRIQLDYRQAMQDGGAPPTTTAIVVGTNYRHGSTTIEETATAPVDAVGDPTSNFH